MEEYDALVVGGGPAGLSAALLLGRCLRRVLVCDAGGQRNLASDGVHGLLGYEGMKPSAFLSQGLADLRTYSSISVQFTTVTSIARHGRSFQFSCASGDEGWTKKILLATGLVDQIPNLPNVAAYYGHSVHHCLYCDGAEYAGRPLIAYGAGEKGAGLALMMRHWSRDVTLCCGAEVPQGPSRVRLDRFGIPVLRTAISELVGEKGRLTGIRLADGRVRPCAAMFFSTGCGQGSDLADRLGCRRDTEGSVVLDPETEETSVPGVYVAGDVSRDVLMVAVALGEGAKAGVAINRALLREEGLL